MEARSVPPGIAAWRDPSVLARVLFLDDSLLVDRLMFLKDQMATREGGVNRSR
jgi:hypothetical protein